jgi:hypothetical protein
VLSGASAYAVAHISPEPQRAMMWSAVYEANGARETYGLKSVGSLVMTHLQSTLSADAADAAKAEAAGFRKIAMSEFSPPARGRAEGRGQSQQRGQRGERPRRRR